MFALSVIQREPGSAVHARGVAWRTCLREIDFPPADDRQATDGRVFHGEAAYAHLLAVICGLDSPIIGETEVMSQFKAFATSIPEDRRELQELSHQLLVDARLVRTRHLIGLGSRSYGSAVRRRVRNCERVAIVGTGMLAHDILPFVAGENRVVDLWGRRATLDLTTPGATYRRVDAADELPQFSGTAAMVIAAPVSSLTIGRLAARYSALAMLIDLRAEGAGDPPPAVAPVTTLADVFAELTQAAASNHRSLELARAEIQRCAGDFMSREKVRPSGWHDLCA